MPHARRTSDSPSATNTRRRSRSRVIPPVIALTAIAGITVFQLTPPAAVAAQVVEPTAMERLGTLLDAGYTTDALLAAGVPVGQVGAVYTAVMQETQAIDNAAGALQGLREATTDLDAVVDEIRRLGLDDARDTTRATARATKETAETTLETAETDLAEVIGDRLEGVVPVGVLDDLRVITANRAWDVPTSWRLAPLTTEDQVEHAEWLAAKVAADPDAQLASDQSALLSSITGDAGVSAAAFRVSSGQDGAQQAFLQYVTQLQGG